MVFLSTAVFPQTVTLTKTGEWGSGVYYDVFVKGNYAYCAAGSSGLDILNIGNLTAPKKVGSYYNAADVTGVHVWGNYAYIVDNGGYMHVIDVSTVSSPVRVSSHYVSLMPGPWEIIVNESFVYISDGISGIEIIDISNLNSPVTATHLNVIPIGNMTISGQYLYIGNPNGLSIIDVSNPRSPVTIGDANDGNWTRGVCIAGQYAYAVGARSLYIININNPSAPVTEEVHSLENSAEGIVIRDRYAYIFDEDDLVVLDIFDHSAISEVGKYSSSRISRLHMDGNLLFAAVMKRGLEIIDISSPGSPTLTGSYNAAGTFDDVYVKGKYAYVAGDVNGLHVIDISNPSMPKGVGHLATDARAIAVHGSGDHVYLAGSWQSLYVVDVSAPAAPRLAATYKTTGYVYDVFVNGSYAYVAAGNDGLLVLDISDPSAPKKTGQYSSVISSKIWVSGNHAYVTSLFMGLYIFDISNPSSPKLVWSGYNTFNFNDIQVEGSDAYLTASQSGLSIIDISDPTAPSQTGQYSSTYCLGVVVKDNYAYLSGTADGVVILDIRSPSSPKQVGNYNGSGEFTDMVMNSGYLYAVGGINGRLLILQPSVSSTSPLLALSQDQLNFAADSRVNESASQSFMVSNAGGGNMSWTVSASTSGNLGWLQVTPKSGNNSGEIYASVDISGLSPGTYTGTVDVTAPMAANSPRSVSVALTVYQSGNTTPPFGIFATPQDNSTVKSSIPVTGWALDDIGIQSVQIFREDGPALVYVGDAAFIEGARPDVEAAYPNYPNNHKAGWGYMLLTNYLPNGDGIYRIHAIATDIEGNQTDLGVKTITVNNADAVKPFGAIDTPLEGGVASGSQFVNFGWALTPLPNTISKSGDSIWVYIDSTPVGHPVYNQYREDVATYFPGYNNSKGAVGYFYLDTTQYENGIHTIQWTATDDAGNTDGIGSRFFKIMNPVPRSAAADKSTAAAYSARYLGLNEKIDRIPRDVSTPVQVRKGFDPNTPMQTVLPNENGIINVRIREMERVSIHLTPNTHHVTLGGYLLAGDRLKPLPIGCNWDGETGILSWFPAHGFFGDYDIILIVQDEHRGKLKKHLRITITAKYRGISGIKQEKRNRYSQ